MNITKSPASGGEGECSGKNSIRGKPSRGKLRAGLFFISAALLSLSLFYLGILPALLKQKIVSRFGSRTSAELIIPSLAVRPYGLKLNNPVVYDLKKKVFLRAGEIKLKLKFSSLLKGKPRLTEIAIDGFSLSIPGNYLKPGGNGQFATGIPITATDGEIKLRGYSNLTGKFDITTLSLIPSGQREEMLCKAKGNFSIQGPPILQMLKGYGDLELVVNEKGFLGNVSVGDTIIQIEKFPAPIKDLKGRISLSGKGISADNLSGEFCGGELKLSLKFDPIKAPVTYAFSCILNQADLSGILQGLTEGPGDISGKLQAELSLTGAGKNTGSIKGNGRLKIAEGKLYEVSFLRGLANILLVPSLEKIVFDSASCEFKLDGEGLHTKNLKLTGNNTGLMIEGSVGYDGGLDLTATTAFTEQLLANLPEFKKIASAFLHTMDYFLIRHKIRGTIKEPEYKAVPLPIIMHLPIQVIKKILGALF